MQKDIKPDNIQSIQFLRGIAAFLVLLCHSVVPGKYFPADHIIAKVCTHGWMGVNIFFIISGFIIPYSMFKNNYELSDFKNFFAKRLVRIEPPYIVSIIMILLFGYVTTVTPWYKGAPFKVDWVNVLGHLGYLNAFTHQPWLNWAYWTLAIEFQYYIIIALFFPMILHKNKAIFFTTFFAILACTFIHLPGVYIMPFTPFDPYPLTGSDSGSQILPFLPFFLIGIAMFLYKVRKINFTEFLMIGIPTLVVCYYRFGLILFAISILTLFCIYYLKKVPAIFMLLGTISYSLYLTHDILVSRFQALIERYINIDVAIVWLISIIACLIVAYIYYLLVEKPFVNLSKRMRFKHPGKTAQQLKESMLEPGDKIVAD